MMPISTAHAASFVTRSGQYLMANGTRLWLHGGSFYGAPWRQGQFNHYVDTWLPRARANGLNTIRICDFIDNRDMEQWKDPRTWANVDYLLNGLAAQKMYGILDLSTYRNMLSQVNGKDTPAGVTAAYDPKNWDAFTAFVSARYKNSTSLAFYSIAGEPDAPAGKKITSVALIDFYDKVSTQLRAGDPHHLISSGGLLFLDWNSGIDWRRIFSLPNIQMAAVHVYSAGDRSVVPTVAKWARQPSVNIPFVIEEFGMKQGDDDAARASYFRDIYSLATRYATIGALFWNLGPELGQGSCDVGPQTPRVWTAVRECADWYRNPPPVATIHNSQLTVTCDHGQYAIQFHGQARPFATGHMRIEDGTMKVVTVKDTDFGEGQAIEISASDGSSETLEVFPGLPFVLYGATLANPTKESVVLNKVPMMDANLDPGQPLDQLVGLGTGGLNPLKSNPGSFAWMTIADPNSRNGVVGGWLTEEHSTGVVLTTLADGQLSMQARLEYGHLLIEPGKTYAAETFALGWFADARLGMEAWADAVAKRLAVKLPPKPVVYCTWYGNEYGGSCDEKHLAQLATFAAKELEPYGFSCVQIDDGWQMGDSRGNGSAKNFSRYNPHGPYPSGMKATANNLRSLGLTAGLWILPFGGTWNDPFFADHQDWFVKRSEDGKPYDTAWGGTTLDMTQPGARAFVADEIRQAVHDWGYHYLKLDGLSTGIGVKPMYVEDSWREDNFGDAVFHDPTRTNIDAFRSGLRLVRKAAGPDTFILGCCAPQNMRSYAGTFGLVNAMRVGPDNGGSWSAWQASPDFGSRNYHLNGRIWWDDPDPMYVRASIPLESARCIASWNCLSGEMISLGDWLPTLPADRLEILRRTIPSPDVTARPIDLFNTWPPREWLVTDERPGHQRRDVIGLYNWSNKPQVLTLPVAGLGLPPADEYIAFDFWNRVFLKPFTKTLTVTVPGAACRVIAVRPLLPRPFLLSTSRHVTQGILEVKKETWNAGARALSGTSAVVAGDVYELRVVACAPAPGWALTGAHVSASDAAAGVAITAAEANGLIRAVITSPVSRDVSWALKFKPAKSAITLSGKIKNVSDTIGEDGEDVRLSWTPVDGATCEVTDGQGAPVVSEVGHCSGHALTPDPTAPCQLTPVAGSGQHGETTEMGVRTPPAPVMTPLPPKPTVSITGLQAVEARTGYGQICLNTSMDHHPLRVGGVTYANGVGVHAESLLVYDVKPGYQRFVSVVGLDDEVQNSPGSVVFKVVAEIGDEQKQLASSPTLRATGGPTQWHFDVLLPAECRRLRLVVEDAGDGINNDHADWVDAGFITETSDHNH
jgi:hypothetical protein